MTPNMDQTRTSTPGSDFIPQDHNGQQSIPQGRILAASPGPQHQGNVYPYGNHPNAYSYQPSYPTTSPGGRYNTNSPEPATYGGMYDDHQLFPSQYTTPVESAATTPSSAYASNNLQMWSGPEASGGTHLEPQATPGAAKNTRYVKPKNKKKKRKDADEEPKFKKLEKPLSELTKDWDHVPIADIAAYVNRSAEVRRKEVEEGKIPGKVKRPMNSFMLYRKAYQNRCKHWCLQQNHQVVSQVCGDSWPMESKEVREQFNEWSRIERLNHQNAHPGYKFSPSKPGAVKAAKRKTAEGAQTDESDLEDFDWEGLDQRPNKQSKVTPKKVPRSSYDYYRELTDEPSYHGHNISPYPGSSPGDMLGQSYSPSPLGDTQNYLQPAHTGYFNPGPAGGNAYRPQNLTAMSPPGLPGGHLYSELDQYQAPSNFSTPDHQIDPSLTATGGNTYGGGYSGQSAGYQGAEMQTDLSWDSSYGLARHDTFAEQPTLGGGQGDLDQLQLHEQNSQILKADPDGWQVEPLEVRETFDKWMDEV